MKLIQVPRRFVADEWGGTETTILRTSHALMREGHDVRIFTSQALAKGIRDGPIEGVPVRRFPYCYPFFGLKPKEIAEMDAKGGNLLSLSLFRALWKEPGVDLMHAHSGKRLGAAVRSAAKLRGIPYVVTLHGGHYVVPKVEAERILEPIQGKTEWGRLFGMLMGSRTVLEDADAVLCVGADELAAASERLPNQRVELMPNGVDCDAFAQGDGAAFRAAYGIPPAKRIILCVSRIDYQKNQLALVDALEHLLPEHPDLQLVLVGPITIDAYLASLGKRMAELEIAGQVTMVPGLRSDDPMLKGAFHAAEVFCLPSQHEPFGIVILEAWAAGLPVVASRVGGIPSFTQDGVDVLHAQPNDIDSLTAQLNRVLSDPALAKRLAKAGNEKARGEYDWKIVTRQLCRLYEELIEAKRSGCS